MDMLTVPNEAIGLGAALLVGCVIGLERGWQERDLREGGRVAGLRTFALVGLLGGVIGILPTALGPWPLVAGLISLALLLMVSYKQVARDSNNLSVTSAVAMLLTLLLGTLAAYGELALSIAAAVIVAVLLDLKPTLHGWLRAVDHAELSAGLQLLVLTAVILPNLPNAAFGPYQALNPHALWWAVILIAGLSLSGHLAMRLSGAQRGLLWTGLLGGLASSTAATLALARFARERPALASAAAAGALVACGVMFFRMVVLIGVIQPALLGTIAPVLLVPGVLLLVWGLKGWRTAPVAGDATIPPMSPYNLGAALGFGAFLATTAVLVPAAKEWLGASGVFALSAVSGFADVDAIVISLARQASDTSLTATHTAIAMGLAALSNTLVKAGLAWGTAGRPMGLPVAKALVSATVAGVLTTGLLFAWAPGA